jgi:drug/metabolite transporter (DMT)-like permease
VALLLVTLVVLFSFQSLFCRLYTSSRGGEGAIPFAVSYALVVGVFTLAANGFSFRPSGATILLGFLNVFMILIFNISMVRAGALGSYAFMMVCMLSGGILVPMVYDIFYVGERLSALKLGGVFAMLAAFVIMNLDGFRGEKSGKYIFWCALLFVVNGLYGILMHLQQLLMEGAQREEMIVTTFLGMAVLTSAFELAVHRRAFLEGFRMSRRSLVFLLISSVCATLAVNILLFAMGRINLTVLNVVNNGGVLVLSAVYAFLIFKEKPAPRTVAGLALACASIVVLSL